MFKKSEIDHLKHLLSKESSYMKRIADMTHLGRTTIHKFFTYETIRSDNAEKIYDAALDLILVAKKRKSRREKRHKFIREREVNECVNEQDRYND